MFAGRLRTAVNELVADVIEIGKTQAPTDAHLVVVRDGAIIKTCFALGAAKELLDARNAEVEMLAGIVGRDTAIAMLQQHSYYAEMDSPQACLDMARYEIISADDAAIRAMFRRYGESIRRQNLPREAALQLADHFSNARNYCVVAALLYATALPNARLAAATLAFDDGSGSIDTEYPGTDFRRKLARRFVDGCGF